MEPRFSANAAKECFLPEGDISTGFTSPGGAGSSSVENSGVPGTDTGTVCCFFMSCSLATSSDVVVADSCGTCVVGCVGGWLKALGVASLETEGAFLAGFNLLDFGNEAGACKPSLPLSSAALCAIVTGLSDS